MHCLFVTPAFPPFPGGGERYVRSLALDLVGRGHRITVLTTNAHTEQDFWQWTPADDDRQEDGLLVIRCGLRGLWGQRRFLLAWRKWMVLVSALPGKQTAVLTKMARAIPPITGMGDAFSRITEPIDLIHGFNISWEYPMLIGWQRARQQGLPFVVTPFAHFGVAGQDRVARNSTMDHQRALLVDAARVLTLTSVERDGLLALGVHADAVQVIGGGLDPLPSFKASVSLPNGVKHPFVLFIGRASFEKGALHAAEATLALRNQGMMVTLVLAGQIAPEFHRFYRRLQSREKAWIRPLGVVSEAEKHKLLMETTMLLLPSRTDSFGIVLLEAWAYGKPVIGARAGGLPGVIDDGQNGLLINFGDVSALSQAIAYLLTEEGKRHSLGQAGYHKIRQTYSWSGVGERVLAAYKQILDG